MTLALANSITWHKTIHFPYLPSFPLQWEIPPYRGPPNQEPHGYFCLTAVFLTPHIQSVTNRCYFFFANVSWIHPFPFHSHSCGLSLGFGLGLREFAAFFPLSRHIHISNSSLLYLITLTNFFSLVYVFDPFILFELHWDCQLLSGLASNVHFIHVTPSSSYLLIVPIFFLSFWR